ncbi:MAG: hypothetical protein ACOC8N_00085 [Spirochaetota bacterium]
MDEDGSKHLPFIDDERTVYLIPDLVDYEDAWESIREVYEEIFENELFGWYTDPAAWPQDRTFEMFLEWFDVEIHSVIEDLCGYELVNEDEE